MMGVLRLPCILLLMGVVRLAEPLAEGDGPLLGGGGQQLDEPDDWERQYNQDFFAEDPAAILDQTLDLDEHPDRPSERRMEEHGAASMEEQWLDSFDQEMEMAEAAQQARQGEKKRRLAAHSDPVDERAGGGSGRGGGPRAQDGAAQPATEGAHLQPQPQPGAHGEHGEHGEPSAAPGRASALAAASSSPIGKYARRRRGDSERIAALVAGAADGPPQRGEDDTRRRRAEAPSSAAPKAAALQASSAQSSARHREQPPRTEGEGGGGGGTGAGGGAAGAGAGEGEPAEVEWKAEKAGQGHGDGRGGQGARKEAVEGAGAVEGAVVEEGPEEEEPEEAFVRDDGLDDGLDDGHGGESDDLQDLVEYHIATDDYASEYAVGTGGGGSDHGGGGRGHGAGRSGGGSRGSGGRGRGSRAHGGAGGFQEALEEQEQEEGGEEEEEEGNGEWGEGEGGHGGGSGSSKLIGPGDYETWDWYLEDIRDSQEEEEPREDWDESMHEVRRLMLQTLGGNATDNSTVTYTQAPIEEFSFELMYIAGGMVFLVCVVVRVAYNWAKRRYKRKWVSRIVPRSYFPTTGSVLSLKRHQYSYPAEVEVDPFEQHPDKLE
jgi:hypothetical protein